MKRSISILVVGFLAVSAAVACCSVAGQGQAVKFGDQTNIIVYDKESKVEHFYRVANFKSPAQDFGFIAPTPTLPKVGEADKAAIPILESLSPVKPPTRVLKSGSFGGSGGGVHVFQVVEAAGYEVTTLKADDSRAMTDWLKKNNYVLTQGVAKWADYYVKKGWYFSAFKFISKSQETATKMVELRFKTDNPYNPYYVPTENRSEPNKLKIYFLGDTTYSARLQGAMIKPKWTSQISSHIGSSLEKLLKLKEDTLSLGSHVTYYELPFPSMAQEDIFFFERLNRNSEAAIKFNPVTSIGLCVLILGCFAVVKRAKADRPIK